MRVYKFRAIHKFDTTNVIYFTLDQVIRGRISLAYPEQWDISVSTGMKDLKDNEIFVGDIVTQVTTLNNDVSVINYKSKYLQSTGVVTWDDEGCDYNLLDKDGKMVSAFGFSDTGYLVLGNIYQHKDLLK